jgi:hypothetical protein
VTRVCRRCHAFFVARDERQQYCDIGCYADHKARERELEKDRYYHHRRPKGYSRRVTARKKWGSGE